MVGNWFYQNSFERRKKSCWNVMNIIHMSIMGSKTRRRVKKRVLSELIWRRQKTNVMNIHMRIMRGEMRRRVKKRLESKISITREQL
jgi:hypothetical protein